MNIIIIHSINVINVKFHSISEEQVYSLQGSKCVFDCQCICNSIDESTTLFGLINVRA